MNYRLVAARARLEPFVARARHFSGWDFSQVRTRRLPPGLPWDYDARARALVAGASAVLDIGTGGGERLDEICAGLAVRTVATEAWPPNVPVASARLKPLGVHVVHCDDEVLPFLDASFDLVLNRHAGLDGVEIARVLRRGGAFITQQLNHMSWIELERFFPRRGSIADHLPGLTADLQGSGMEVVEAVRNQTGVAHQELGDLVLNLLATPWEISDFDPLGSDLDALLDLEAALVTADGIVLTEGRDFVLARKP